jgi:hypothetical protein
MSEIQDLLTNPLLMPLFRDQILDELRTQLAIGNYLSPPEETAIQPDKTFTSNEVLWDAILSERVRSSCTIKLENFLLFEWFPRSPGLYYTDQAKSARKDALNYTIQYPISSQLKGIDNASKVGDPLVIPDFMRIFDPYGKIQMLHGGIGSIRLKNRTIDKIGSVWFMTASSTCTAHEGFPIALPDHYYQQYIDQIVASGVAPCTIIGKLCFVPDTLQTLYQDSVRVPQLYLLVEDIKPATRAESQKEIPRVSVAVMFRSNYQGGNNVFFSYVTFFPSKPGSFASRVDWLENTYVESMYKGEIITDFDEHKKWFETVQFGLHQILDKQISMKDVNEWVHQEVIVQGDATFLLDGSNLVNIHAERIDNVTHQEKTINIGNGATISAPIVIADTIENSFNALNNSTQIDKEVRDLLDQLVKAVTELNRTVLPEKRSDAETMARDTETLVKEVTSSKPRHEWYEVSIDGLKKAATNIGELANPVLQIVEKLLPFLMLTA